MSTNLVGKKLPNFPIWEKVYLEIKEKFIYSYFENAQAIPIGSSTYFFPKSTTNKSTLYFIFNAEEESLKQEEMEIVGFYPIYDKGEIIYLFRVEDDLFSEFRYSIVEFNINSREWKVLNSSGTAPKKRTDGKVFWFNLFRLYGFLL
jgi:hypothetical protein